MPPRGEAARAAIARGVACALEGGGGGGGGDGGGPQRPFEAECAEEEAEARRRGSGLGEVLILGAALGWLKGGK